MAPESHRPGGGIGRHRAWSIARNFAVQLAAETRPGDLRAVFLVGSLGGGYYRPGHSDIDTALVLADDSLEQTLATRRRLQRQYQVAYGVPKGFGAVPLRLRQLRPPYAPQEELVPEIIRLKEQGTPLWGRFDLDALPYPTDKDFLAWCRVFYPWIRAKQHEPLPEGPLRTATLVNRLLHELRLGIWHFERRHVFDKRRTVPAFVAASGGAFSAELAMLQRHLEHNAVLADLPGLEKTLAAVSAYVADAVPLDPQ